MWGNLKGKYTLSLTTSKRLSYFRSHRIYDVLVNKISRRIIVSSIRC